MKYTFKTKFWNVIFKIKRSLKLFIRRFKSQNILAVYDSDLDSLLKKLNLYDKIKQNKFSCNNCRTIITRENLGIITNENDKIQIYCISTGCNRNHYNLEVND
jgi:hypothetical protein